MKFKKIFKNWIPAFAGMTAVTFLFAADPTPTPSPVPAASHRLKMGQIDKKEKTWWKKTERFLETGIGVALFFWLPGAKLSYRANDVSVNVGS